MLLLGLGHHLLFESSAASAQVLSKGSPNAVLTTPDPGQLPVVDKDGGWLFRRQVDEVTVMFTATHKGKYVADLRPVDVQVQDDKKAPAGIMAFRNEQDLPLRLGLLIDTSGSVNRSFHNEMQAASQFVRQVVDREHDRVFVAGFSRGLRITQDFTQDPAKVSSGLGMLQDDQGDTALFDAMVRACSKLAASRDQQPVARVLVVISDGDDNASKYVLEDAVQIAQWGEVTIYTINSNPRGFNPIGDDVLHKLAEQSGGQALFADSKQQVAKTFARIRDELRNRYAVSYRPSAFKPDGHFRRIRIVVRRFGKKLRVHARKGYYARPILAGLIGASRH
jgi:VWFA-related protein